MRLFLNTGAATQNATLVVKWNEAAVTLFSAAALPPPVIGRAVFVTHNCLYDTWAAYNDTAIGLYWPRGFQRQTQVCIGPLAVLARSLSPAWLPDWRAGCPRFWC